MILQNFIFLSGMYLIGHSALSQSITPDTSFVARAKQNEVARYEKIMVSQSRLYNGTGYREYNSQEDEHPYLINDWEDGSIYYDSELFTDIPLMVNIADDKIIIEHYSSHEKIQLIENKISWFTLKHRRFVRLIDGPSRAGFFEVLYGGPTKVYVKWQKSLQKQISGNKIQMYFEEKSFCYIFKNNVYHSVKTKKSVLNALADHKSELNKFIREKNLDFRSDREKSIARVTEYYDSLVK